MTDQNPADRPGHLDIDAVSAFVDRDLAPNDLATLEFHLHQCPACHREVLEITATVMLLAALPQYAPRRSFCLGQEFARQARRAAAGGAWSGGFAPAWQVAPGSAPPPPGGGRAGAWLPGLQTMAVAVGAMLLLVTMGDMLGFTATTSQQFAAPMAYSENPAPANDVVAPDETQLTPLPMPTLSANSQAPAEMEAAAPAPASEPATFRQTASSGSDGTNGVDSASEEMLADDTAAPAPASGASSSVVALLTPVAGTVGESPAEPVAGTNAEATTGSARPSDLRLMQIGLAVLLGWLVVTIIGLRRVRALP